MKSSREGYKYTLDGRELSEAEAFAYQPLTDRARIILHRGDKGYIRPFRMAEDDVIVPVRAPASDAKT